MGSFDATDLTYLPGSPSDGTSFTAAYEAVNYDLYWDGTLGILGFPEDDT
jgi:hypothetical protein